MGLLNHLKDAVHYVGNKLASGASWIGDKVNKIGSAVGNVADTVAGPASFILGPEAGAAIKAVGAVANTAANIGHDAKVLADNYQNRNAPSFNLNTDTKVNPGLPITPMSKMKDSIGSIGQQMPSLGDVKSGLSEGVSSVKSMLPNFRFA